MRIILIILTFALTFLPAEIAIADGVSFFFDGGVGQLINEAGQDAQIKYQDGYETLALSVNLVGVNDINKAVWIFPIPASPEDTKLDINEGILGEALYPEDTKPIYKSLLVKHFKLLTASQLYTILFLNIESIANKDKLIELHNKIKEMYRSRKQVLADNKEQINIIQSINRYGLTSELISANNADTLADYLISKNLILPREFIKISNEYVKKNYLFVVSWFSDSEQFKIRRKQTTGTKNIIEICVNFKTSKIFFPLKMTSIYGSSKIPISILVYDHVYPELYPEIVTNTFKGHATDQVKYLIDDKNFYTNHLRTYVEYIQTVCKPNYFSIPFGIAC